MKLIRIELLFPSSYFSLPFQLLINRSQSQRQKMIKYLLVYVFVKWEKSQDANTCGWLWCGEVGDTLTVVEFSLRDWRHLPSARYGQLSVHHGKGQKLTQLFASYEILPFFVFCEISVSCGYEQETWNPCYMYFVTHCYLLYWKNIINFKKLIIVT